MKADLTRKSFDPLNHFSRVLMQQGRVQLDADWNEQGAILLHLLRRLTADIVGPAAGAGSAFTLQPVEPSTVVVDDVAIAPGEFYVDGIMCELEATPVAVLSWGTNTIGVAEWTIDRVAFQKGQYLRLSDDASATTAAIIAKVTDVGYASRTLTLDQDVTTLRNSTAGRARRLTTYLTQPDLSTPPALSAGTYQMYLDVWERVITCLEDDAIREVALNGPDTAARARVVWQLKALPIQPAEGSAVTCMSQTGLIDQLQPWNRGLLRARTQPSPSSTDPCAISPDSRYRGPENQLYRVEIHTGSNDPSGQPASFKWSRENGAVVFPVVKLAAGDGTTTVTLGNLGRDDRFGLAEGDFVEVQDDYSVLANLAGTLLQVQSIDRSGSIVVLAGTTTPGVGADPTLHPLLRRWDHRAGDPTAGGLTLGTDNAARIPSGNVWLNLEDGAQVEFVDLGEANPATYRTGDYWLIPARVATGDVVWPTETVTDTQGNAVNNPVARRPDGVEHHYAPLAIVKIDGKTTPSITICSRRFNSLTAVT